MESPDPTFTNQKVEDPSHHATLDEIEKCNEAVAFLKPRISRSARIGIIAGTGLGVIAESIDVDREIPYGSIPHFPSSGVTSHDGVLVIGTLHGVDVLCLKGRVHLYEDYTPAEIVLSVRVLAELGVQTLFVTNAAGGLNRNFARADVMVITDHINLLATNPLIGPNVERWGERFPDVSDLYATELVSLAMSVATDIDAPLQSGVYASILGPNLETKAEYTMLGKLGADAIGMSTTLEAIAALHMGLRVCGFSIITDECFPETLAPVNIEDVLEAASIGGPILSSIIEEMVVRLGHGM